VLVRQARQLPRGRVDLVDHGGGAAHHDVTGRGQPHAVVPAFQQPGARGPFERRDLPGHRGLRVPERGRRRGEGAALGHLPEHAQRGQRGIGEGHDT
jgi:hypothetical protein